MDIVFVIWIIRQFFISGDYKDLAKAVTSWIRPRMTVLRENIEAVLTDQGQESMTSWDFYQTDANVYERRKYTTKINQ